MRVQGGEYGDLDLRAHSLLADVPLHDVWAVDLDGGGPNRTMLNLRELLSMERIARVSPAVRLLFAVRGWLGRILSWDREPSGTGGTSYINRLSAHDRKDSLVEPGTVEGPFRVLYISSAEAILEIRNATVHAFSVFALRPREGGYRMLWAIYVKPVGPLTAWYMRLIDPFRRLIVYPAVLRYVRSSWARNEPADEEAA